MAWDRPTIFGCFPQKFYEWILKFLTQHGTLFFFLHCCSIFILKNLSHCCSHFFVRWLFMASWERRWTRVKVIELHLKIVVLFCVRYICKHTGWAINPSVLVFEVSWRWSGTFLSSAIEWSFVSRHYGGAQVSSKRSNLRVVRRCLLIFYLVTIIQKRFFFFNETCPSFRWMRKLYFELNYSTGCLSRGFWKTMTFKL